MEIPTPSIVVDDAVLRKNIQRMSDYAKQYNLELRPHTKTHKSLYAASLQLEFGATGLSVAKVGEAEVMADVCADVMLAYPIVDYHRCERIASLADRITVRVGTDSALSVERLAAAACRENSTVGILIDFDLGYGRTGVQSVAAAVELAEFADQQRGARLDGIMLYSGHITGVDSKQSEQFQELVPVCQELLTEFDRKGLCRALVSSGSTPSAYNTHLLEFVTELRPGTYVYNDMNIVHGGYASLADCAARIRSTVVSDAVPNQVVLDAGTKTLTSDLCGPMPGSGHGYIVEYPDAKITKLTEEHAQVDVGRSGSRPAVGDVVTIIPNHICPCVNLQDGFWLLRDGNLEQRTVDTRGCVV